MQILLVVLASLIANSYSQTPVPRTNVGSCAPLTIDDLGNTTMLSRSGILPEFLLEEPGQRDMPMAQIFAVQEVCQVAGLTRGTISATSFIVDFNCTVCPGADNMNPVRVTQQFQLDCNANAMPFNNINRGPSFEFPLPGVTGGFTRIRNPVGNLNTSLNDRCGLCISTFARDVNASILARVNNETHCVGKRL